MRMSELVSSLTPSHYAQIALVLFVGVFAYVAWRTRRLTTTDQHMSNLPLVDDVAVPAKGAKQ